MNRSFIYKNGEIKVIWNEIPMLKGYKKNWISKKIQKRTKQILNSFLIGIELKIHKGGRICYGMLIARFRPYKEKDSIKVFISFTKENTVRYKDSILLNDKFVYEGMPGEYVEQVSNSIYKAISEKNEYLQCEIFFDYAANCEVGSSPMLFGIIAEMIIELAYTSSPDEISRINIEDFSKRYTNNINLRY